MSDKPRRAWFQIHLSTAIVMMFVAGGTVGAIVWLVQKFQADTVCMVRLVNCSQDSLTNVSFEWKPINANVWEPAKACPYFSPKEALSFKTSNDVEVRIKYTIDNTPKTFQGLYVDLWAGETYTFQVHDDGSVAGIYDSSGGR